MPGDYEVFTVSVETLKDLIEEWRREERYYAEHDGGFSPNFARGQASGFATCWRALDSLIEQLEQED